MANRKQKESTLRGQAGIESSVLVAAKLDEIGQIAKELQELGYNAAFYNTKVGVTQGLFLFLPCCVLTDSGDVVELKADVHGVKIDDEGEIVEVTNE